MHPPAFTPLLSSTPTIPILYGDVDASTRRWRPSSLLPQYINKGHLDAFSRCLGGFLGGEERCRGARGKMWSGRRSGCIRPSIWVVVGPSVIFLPSSSLCLVALDILLPGCATQLLWMRLHCVIRRCYGFSGPGIDQTRIGSSSNASTV